MRKTIFALAVMVAGTFAFASGTPASAMSASPFTAVQDTAKADNAVTKVGHHGGHHWGHHGGGHHWGHHRHWRHHHWGWRPYWRRHGWHCWWRYGERYCGWW